MSLTDFLWGMYDTVRDLIVFLDGIYPFSDFDVTLLDLMMGTIVVDFTLLLLPMIANDNSDDDNND